MRKFTCFALLFPILFGLTVSVGSQTRPRRVTQPTNTSTSLASTSETNSQERQRTSRARTPELREGRRESRWPAILLSTGISLGASRIGHGSSCGPSRGSILSGPRFISLPFGR